MPSRRQTVLRIVNTTTTITNIVIVLRRYLNSTVGWDVITYPDVLSLRITNSNNNNNKNLFLKEKMYSEWSPKI